MKKVISIFAIVLSMSGLIWLLGQGMAIGKTEARGANKALPHFEAIDIRGHEKVTRDSLFLGKVKILHVWASWCGPCLHEHDLWIKMNKAYPNVLIGVLYRDSADKAKAYLESKGDPYSYLLDDSNGSIGLKLGIRGTPETFIIDKKGVIRYHQVGSFSRSEFEQSFLPLYKKLLAE